MIVIKKNISGYTLIEIIAVIALVGLITLIVYPEFNISPERNEIIYIGKILTSDIRLLKEESFSSKQEITVTFQADGYSFAIDESDISRNFIRYQFAFDVPVPEADGTPGPGETPEPGTEHLGVEPTATPNSGSGDQGTSEEQQDETGDEDELEPNQLRFTSDGKCNVYELAWQSVHFTGKLKVDQDGVVDWSYARK